MSLGGVSGVVLLVRLYIQVLSVGSASSSLIRWKVILCQSETVNGAALCMWWKARELSRCNFHVCLQESATESQRALLGFIV